MDMGSVGVRFDPLGGLVWMIPLGGCTSVLSVLVLRVLSSIEALNNIEFQCCISTRGFILNSVKKGMSFLAVLTSSLSRHARPLLATFPRDSESGSYTRK